MNHKKQVAHINRLKPTYNTETWKPKPSAEVSSKPATRPNKRARQKVTRKVDSEEDEVRIGPFPLLKARTPVDQVETTTPPSLAQDTPDYVQTSPDSPVQKAEILVTNPLRTPRSRRELQTTRKEPPLTRKRARDRTQDHNTVAA